MPIHGHDLPLVGTWGLQAKYQINLDGRPRDELPMQKNEVPMLENRQTDQRRRGGYMGAPVGGVMCHVLLEKVSLGFHV